MKYVKAYLKAFLSALKIFGLAYLLISALEGDKATSIIFLYYCFIIALGGPIGVWITESEKRKI